MSFGRALPVEVVTLCLSASGASDAPAVAAADEAQQAFRPGAIWLDDNATPINAHVGGILWRDEVYCWFGQRMIGGREGRSAGVGVQVYTSVDLDDWRDAGIALRVADDLAGDIARGCTFECLNHGTAASRAGVAVAEHVLGPYRFIGSFRSNVGVFPLDGAPKMKESWRSDEGVLRARLAIVDSIWGRGGSGATPASAPRPGWRSAASPPRCCRSWAGRARSSSWPTAGTGRASSTAVTSGCRSNSGPTVHRLGRSLGPGFLRSRREPKFNPDIGGARLYNTLVRDEPPSLP